MTSAIRTAGQAVDFRVAGHPDVAGIASLVNRAYRPEPGHAGWTHEAHLVGGMRTNAGQVEGLMAAPGSALLVGVSHDQIVACVQAEATEGCSYIGMLAVDPAIQANGLGTQMLDFAERYAREVQCASKFVMTVVSHRKELVSFYLRRGYRLTGRTQGFPSYAGVPKQPGLELVELEKPVPQLDAPDVASASLNT
jgi:GNAT superfamily N-acetyltransferase